MGADQAAAAERQTDRLQPVTRLVKMQDFALTDYGVIIADDPPSGGSAHAWSSQKLLAGGPTYLLPPSRTTLSLPHFGVLPFAKKQQMQWSRTGAHWLLQTRTQTLDGTLRETFIKWYPAMATNDNEVALSAAAA
jgi:hypothetical protein